MQVIDVKGVELERVRVKDVILQQTPLARSLVKGERVPARDAFEIRDTVLDVFAQLMIDLCVAPCLPEMLPDDRQQVA